MDEHADTAQALTQATADPRVATYVSQLSGRFHALKATAKVHGICGCVLHVNVHVLVSVLFVRDRTFVRKLPNDLALNIWCQCFLLNI